MKHFYAPSGDYKAYQIDNSNHLFDANGKGSIGYFVHDKFFSQNSEYLGYMVDNWMYDTNGNALYYYVEI